MDDYRPPALSSAARHGHVDPRSPLREQIPQNGSTEVTQDRAFSGGEDGSQEAAGEGKGLAAHHEHATMNTYQPTRPYSTRDCVVAEADPEQLSARDDRMLAGGEIGELRIRP